jgi:predicted permease
MGDWISRNLDLLWRNLHYAGRRLARTPGFTAIAVFSLALGIGASTAMFSLVNAVVLRKLPIAAPEEVLAVYLSTPDYTYNVFSYPDFEDLRDDTGDVFSGLAATRLIFAQADHDGSIEMIAGEAVSGGFFQVLGVEAQLGRTLLPEDDIAAGAHPVVMLGHKYWQSRFAGDPDVVGKEIRLGGRTYAIIGVAHQDYSGSFATLTPAIYAPMMMINQLQPGTTDQLTARGNHSIFVKGRMQSGVSLPQVQGAVDSVAARLTELAPEDWDKGSSFLLIPQEEVIFYPPMDSFIRAASWLLMIVVSLVLLMACTNLASFLLAKTLDRSQEIAVRLALGARRRSLAGQLLVETTLLGVLGGIAGLILAVALLRLLVVVDLPLPLPIDLELGLDGTVLTFALAISLAAGLLLGMAPAMQSFRGGIATSLRNESAGGGRRGKQRLRNALVVSQVSISLTLLLGAGLFIRSMGRVEAVDPGFGKQPASLLSFLIPSTRYDEEEGRLLVQELFDRFVQLPGVVAVGLTDNLHLNSLSTQNIGVNVDGVAPPPDRESHTVDRAVADAGFFAATGIEILQGRSFDRRDQPDSQAVAIISQAMAQKFWPDQDPIGQVIRRANDPDLTVIGVAADAKVRTLAESPRAFVYQPFSQRFASFVTVVAQTRSDPERTAVAMVSAAREIEPELHIWESKTIARHLSIMLLPAQLSAFLLSAFAGLALTLSLVGLYGVVSYAVAQRRREVGIRISLGASSSEVTRLLLSGGLKIVAIGGVIGLAVTAVISRLLGGLLYEVSPLDPLTFIMLPLLLVAISLLATLVPARAASRIDPATVLKTE